MKRLFGLPREILYFGAIGSYGFAIGIVYWFLTYETAGSVLLTLFGVASLFFAVVLTLSLRRARSADTTEAGLPVDPPATTEGPFGTEPGRVPTSTLAPLQIGIAIALASLSLAFGIWMAIAAVVPFLTGVLSWLHSSERELLASSLDEAAAGEAPLTPIASAAVEVVQPRT